MSSSIKKKRCLDCMVFNHAQLHTSRTQGFGGSGDILPNQFVSTFPGAPSVNTFYPGADAVLGSKNTKPHQAIACFVPPEPPTEVPS